MNKLYGSQIVQNSAQTVFTILAKSIQFVHAQCTLVGNSLEIEFIS